MPTEDVNAGTRALSHAQGAFPSVPAPCSPGHTHFKITIQKCSLVCFFFFFYSFLKALFRSPNLPRDTQAWVCNAQPCMCTSGPALHVREEPRVCPCHRASPPRHLLDVIGAGGCRRLGEEAQVLPESDKQAQEMPRGLGVEGRWEQTGKCLLGRNAKCFTKQLKFQEPPRFTVAPTCNSHLTRCRLTFQVIYLQVHFWYQPLRSLILMWPFPMSTYHFKDRL